MFLMLNEFVFSIGESNVFFVEEGRNICVCVWKSDPWNLQFLFSTKQSRCWSDLGALPAHDPPQPLARVSSKLVAPSVLHDLRVQSIRCLCMDAVGHI